MNRRGSGTASSIPVHEKERGCCYPPPQPSPLLPTFQGPACHCGRSRPILLLSCYPPPPPSSFLPTHQGPACHCGRSRLVSLLSLLIPTSFPFPFHLARLSLWQVPPRLASFLLPATTAFSLPSHAPRPGLSLWQVSPLSLPYYLL